MLNRASVNDNGVITSYSPSALNQYQTYNGVIYNYDSNFNLREAPNWWGVFDAENRLAMAGGGGNVVSLTYDGLGRCVRRIVYPPGGGSSTVIYVYDGWKPVLEFDAAGNYRASNIYGTGADEILFRWDTVYGGFIYKQDRHGNVVAVLDQWGNIVERYSYDAFGKPKIMSWWDNNERASSWIGNRFMFQGREYLSELNIYDYRHRFYQPTLGRFLQSDPTGFDAGDMNHFRYCGDDPVDRSDPMGLEGEHFSNLEAAIHEARSQVMAEVLNPNRQPSGVRLTTGGGAGRTLQYFAGVAVPVLTGQSGKGYDLGKLSHGRVVKWNGNYYDSEGDAKLNPRLLVQVHSHNNTRDGARPGLGTPGWSEPDRQLKMGEKMNESRPGVWDRRTRLKDGSYKQDTYRDNGSKQGSGGSDAGGQSSSGSQSSGPTAAQVDAAHQGTGVPSLGAESVNFAPGRP
jgi:RHS repeat-associated protein